ncbi:MAG: molybdopterin molybdotransferase MoeA [Candidatus Wallbacteria bacterium]|nr:molybdopterin molybdotransferase MoeA [Candidatus Wallbacteria bacterium]
MLTVEEALEIVLGHAQPLAPVSLPLRETLGRVLAQDVVASEDLPAWPNSAMDGYAVQAACTPGASRQAPVRLEVIGQIGAGQVFAGRVGPGQALKIMTGAPFPEGADSIVIVEETDGAASGSVRIFKPATAGDHVRPRGEEVRAGELVLACGRTLRPAEIGMLATLGHATVRVHEPPRVAILATGDELREPGEPLAPGTIRNSNAYALAAQVATAGAIPVPLGIARDTPEELLSKMRRGLEEAHVLVSSGGVSMGEFDFVADVMRALEATVHFDAVALAPGKPTTFATAGPRLLFGLPGNPVSSMVTFELFVRPALRKMAGATRLFRPRVEAELAVDFKKKPGRRTYVRCVLTAGPAGYRLTPTGTQSSGVVRSMALANALAIVEAPVDRLPAGSRLPAILLDFPEDAALPEA